MFDIGFSELLLVALVALLVFGPERLPHAARVAGLWIGRIKRSVSNIKAEVEREIGADEIRRQLHNEEILRMERELKESMQIKLPNLDPSMPSNANPTPEAPAPAPAPASVSPTASTGSTAPSSASPAPSEPPRQP